jgi:hypothetical protein
LFQATLWTRELSLKKSTGIFTYPHQTVMDLIVCLRGFDTGTGESPAFTVPSEFLNLASLVTCHRDPERWATLYRVLWRIIHGERQLLKITTDDDVFELTQLHKSVTRDLHKMKAFVRFRKVVVGEQPGDREDQIGRPFVGPAGELLDEALRLAPIDRSLVYITNVVKHFKFTETQTPRGKRRLH